MSNVNEVFSTRLMKCCTCMRFNKSSFINEMRTLKMFGLLRKTEEWDRMKFLLILSVL
jgi:hypothetical protein